ncbi:hypothetical protein D3C80_816110 [compost metagenome]
MPRDIGLQRKLVQQRFAERVDCLDLQAAGRLQRLCKQPPRLGELGRIRLITFDAGYPLAQLLVGKHRPFRQPLEHAVRHLRCRSLGIGEAQNGGGAATGQQQPYHPLGQNMRLARTGIGRNPGRASRIRSTRLLQRGPVDPLLRFVAGRQIIALLQFICEDLTHRLHPLRHHPPSTIPRPGRDDHIHRRNRPAQTAPAAKQNRHRRFAVSARTW